MPTDALITMLVAIALVWGGLAFSIAHAVRVHRADKVRDPKASAPDA